MPFYQYSVLNSQGLVVMGTLQADSVDAARAVLTSSGYRVQSVEDLAGKKPSTQAKPTPASSNTTVSVASRPSSRPVAVTPPQSQPVRPTRKVESPTANQLNAISDPKPKPDSYKTKFGSDKDLFFLFSQLGSYFRSGINPAQALTDLSKRTPEKYRDSLQHAASAVAEGGKMSDVFEKYPYLYPPDVAGTVRVGETAGFLPEAMDEISTKMELSHRLKRRLMYFQYMFIFAIATFPLCLGVINGALHSIELQDKGGGSLPVAGTLGKAVGATLFHDLPVTLLVAFGLWAFFAWFRSLPMRNFRHGLVIRTPIIAGRAMAESMARMTWAMGLVSRAGLSPQQTFQLGVQTVPNLAVRKRLEAEGRNMTESDKLSSALRRSALLPVEYGNIVETGEITGDVPRALEHVTRATDADFQGRNATAVTSSSFVLYGGLAVLVLILTAILAMTWYTGLFRVIPTDGSMITLGFGSRL